MSTWCYIWCWKQHSIIVAHFQQKCCFSATNVVFSFKSRFLLEWMCIILKNQYLLPKNNILLKMSNTDAMWLPASNIASWTHVDNSNQHPSTILRFSKNLDFWQILKMDFEVHICCNEYDLSNITNWQHIGGGLCGNKLATNLCLPNASQFNFHLWCRFFSYIDKINNFWQQKQQVLFSSNMTPKVLLT